MAKQKLCDDCTFGKRSYADGYISRDWSNRCADPSTLPVNPDPDKYWTYLECAKNSKGLKFINLAGDCMVYQARK